MNKRDLVQISPDLLRPRIAELGKIKIGGKGEERKATGSNKTYRLPVKLDHFVVTKRAVDKKTDTFVRDEAIHAKIGDKPSELDCFLMWDEPADNFQYFLAAYDGKRERCRGNGQVAFDREAGQIPCTCPLLKQHEGEYAGPVRPQNVTCKPHGRLSVVLPQAETYGGYHVFRTTSWETISSIAGALAQFRAEFGGLRGLPLRLVMYQATDTYEEGGLTKQSTSYKVTLVLRADFKTAYQVAAAAREWRSQYLLPAGETEQLRSAHREQLITADETDAGEISDEFHPDEPPTKDADFEIEADEPDPLEPRIRRCLQLMKFSAPKINQKLAEYDGRLAELADKLEQHDADKWRHSAEEPKPEPAAAAAPAGLFD